MFAGPIARRTFTGLGPRSRLPIRSLTVDLIYIASGIGIFVLFGLYAYVLRRV